MDSKDRTADIGEVTSAMRQLDEMIQHNAALAEETNAAIAQTEMQANELGAIVATSRVPGATVENRRRA